MEVSLPRFRLEDSLNMKSALVSLGMNTAFSKSADFSGMTGKRILSGMPKIYQFRADHPFVFLVRHRPSGCILFMGRTTNP